MNISVTDKEFEAISFAIDQIESSMESSENEDWNDLANENMNLLYSVCRKFKEARMKANELNEARRIVRSKNSWLPQSKVDKLARQILRRAKDI